jgi:hypothetical protein
MSHSKISFARAIDSQFERLGQDAVYMHADGHRQNIRIIARLSEQLFELGEQSLHAENVQFSLRANEVATPVVGDQIHIDNVIYVIKTEPRVDIHQLLWKVDMKHLH